MDAAVPDPGSVASLEESREQVKAEITEQHRKVAACEACRRSKVKCERGPAGDRCRRCILQGHDCTRPPFHVGRRKGVKK